MSAAPVDMPARPAPRQSLPTRHLEPAPERNYAAEMRAVIDAETSGGPYASPVVAQHVVNKLRATDPDLLDGWLHAQAVQFVRMMINQRDSSTRTHARTSARRRAFAEDAALHEAGAEDAMVGWLLVVHVVEGGDRKRLADMTAADLTFVAEDYNSRARENEMHAAFLKALAKRVGKRTVADVFTEPKLAELWRSIAGSR